jgi:hypothetical protein
LLILLLLYLAVFGQPAHHKTFSQNNKLNNNKMTIKQNKTQQRSTMMIIATVVSVLFPSMSMAFTIISPPSSFSSSITAAISRRHNNNKNRYLPQQHGLKNLDLYSSIDDNDQTVVPLDEEVVEEVGDDDDEQMMSVRTPLKFIGSYPCMALRFPNLATESQREKNITGISLDFVLDTASNINTIQDQVAQQLQLENLIDSRALPGVSSSGPIAGGDTFMLGDSQLEEVIFPPSASSALKDTATTDTVDDDDDGDEKIIQKEPRFEFMQKLTASALPVANPGSAGLLGLAFFYCFEGGVEFRWGDSPQQLQQQQQQQEEEEPKLVDGMVIQQQGSSLSSSSSQPSITFHGNENDEELQRTMSELTRVKIEPIPLTQLPTVRIKINNVEMVALLDTGSPVTVLNERAAKAAGIKTTKSSLMTLDDDGNKNKNSWNPFASVVDKFKEAQATSEAASKGDILMIGGIDGQPTNLYRSINDGISISLVGDDNDDDVPFGGDQDSSTNNSHSKNTVYVGNIPGLAALNGIGVDSPPAVVLGLDILRKRPSMLLRARNNEVYF